jgi:hypothetical protein
VQAASVSASRIAIVFMIAADTLTAAAVIAATAVTVLSAVIAVLSVSVALLFNAIQVQNWRQSG